MEEVGTEVRHKLGKEIFWQGIGWVHFRFIKI